MHHLVSPLSIRSGFLFNWVSEWVTYYKSFYFLYLRIDLILNYFFKSGLAVKKIVKQGFVLNRYKFFLLNYLKNIKNSFELFFIFKTRFKYPLKKQTADAKEETKKIFFNNTVFLKRNFKKINIIFLKKKINLNLKKKFKFKFNYIINILLKKKYFKKCNFNKNLILNNLKKLFKIKFKKYNKNILKKYKLKLLKKKISKLKVSKKRKTYILKKYKLYILKKKKLKILKLKKLKKNLKLKKKKFKIYKKKKRLKKNLKFKIYKKKKRLKESDSRQLRRYFWDLLIKYIVKHSLTKKIFKLNVKCIFFLFQVIHSKLKFVKFFIKVILLNSIIYSDIKILFKKVFKNKLKVFSNNIFIRRLKRSVVTSFFISEYIKFRLIQHYSLNSIFKTIKKALIIWSKLFGYKVQVMGRPFKTSRSRKFCLVKGNLKTNFFTKNIDYSHSIVRTKYGICGIKVWLHKPYKKVF